MRLLILARDAAEARDYAGRQGLLHNAWKFVDRLEDVIGFYGPRVVVCHRANEHRQYHALHRALTLRDAILIPEDRSS